MRNIMLVCCTAALLLCGCDSSERDKHGRLVAEPVKCEDKRIGDKSTAFVLKDNGNIYVFKYVVIDDHEYIMCKRDRGIGIAHSPNCQCRK